MDSSNHHKPETFLGKPELALAWPEPLLAYHFFISIVKGASWQFLLTTLE